MLERRKPDSQESAESSSSAKSSTSDSGSSKLPMLRRTQAMGTRGLHAASIGWVLVGCIAFGFLVGAALDRHFGTTICMPVGVLIGIAAGFTEMFRMLAELQKDQDKLKKSFSNSKPEQSASQSTLIEENRPRPNIFNVPEPPVPSYLKKPGEAERTQVEPEAVPEDAEVEALIEKLLSKDKDGDAEKKS